MELVTITVRRVGDLINARAGSRVRGARTEGEKLEKAGTQTHSLAKNCAFSLFRRDNAANIRILPFPCPRCLHRQLQLHFPCGSAVKSSCKSMRHHLCGPKSGNENKAKRVASVPGGIARALFRLFPSLSTAPTLALDRLFSSLSRAEAYTLLLQPSSRGCLLAHLATGPFSRAITSQSCISSPIHLIF
jgi:hypothetical protein